MDAKLNSLPPINDFRNTYILGQYPHEEGFRAARFDEAKAYISGTSGDLGFIDQGGDSEFTAVDLPIPQGPGDYKVQTGKGWFNIRKQTAFPVTPKSINAPGDINYWWGAENSARWTLVQSINLPEGKTKVEDWTPGTYYKGDMKVGQDGIVYRVVSNTTTQEPTYNSSDWAVVGKDIDVVDNVETPSSTEALSARQGYLLNQKVEGIPIVEVIDGFDSQDQEKASSANSANILYNIKLNANEKGVPNGLATLGSTGKIKPDQIDLDGLHYKGLWDASTNTPQIQNGSGTDGDFYMVSVEGTQDLGNGSIDYTPFSYVIYADGIWEQNTGTRAIAPADYDDYFGL